MNNKWVEEFQLRLQAQSDIQGTEAQQLLQAIDAFTFKGHKDTSSQSREILEDEYGVYLENRLNTDDE